MTDHNPADNASNDATEARDPAEAMLGVRAETTATRDDARRRARAEHAEAKLARKAERQSRGPSVWKTYVVPALTILFIGAIAAALVKLAFFPDEPPEPTAIEPGFVTSDPTVIATIGTVVNEVTAEGSVVQDASKKVRANAAGTVAEILSQVGATVAAGDALYTIRSETTPAPTEDEPMPEPVVTWWWVEAPVTGVVTELPMLIGQAVQIGDDMGVVQPSTFHIEAPMTAEQQYRLVALPADAQVALRGGPAPFTCTGLEIVQPTSGSGTGEEGGSVSQATARCDIPTDVRVFPGLTADVTIAAGIAENVLTLPVTALVGTSETGVVYAPDADGGEPQPIDVTLGMNDGTLVEVTGGIEEGTEVLQFAPGQSAEVDPCAPETYDPMLCGVPIDEGEVIVP